MLVFNNNMLVSLRRSFLSILVQKNYKFMSLTFLNETDMMVTPLITFLPLLSQIDLAKK